MIKKIVSTCCLFIGLSGNAQKLLVFRDSCNDNRFNWGIAKTAKDSLAYYFENGVYVFHNQSRKFGEFKWVQRSFGAEKTANTSIQMDVSLISGAENKGYGLVYNAKDGNNYINFLLTSTGFYFIGAIKDGKTNGNTSSWVNSSLIKKGYNAVNRLKIEQRGDKHFFYLNEVLVKTLDFPAQPFQERFGLIVREEVKCSFDNVEVCQWLPENDLPGKVNPGFVSSIEMPIAAKPIPAKDGKPSTYLIKKGGYFNYGLVDKDGYRLLDPLYNYISVNANDGFVYVENFSRSKGIFNHQLEPIVPMILGAWVSGFTKEGYLSCKMPNGLWGVIDKTGKTILPFVYQNLDIVSEGTVFVKLGNLWGAVNLRGDTVLKFGLVTDTQQGYYGANVFRKGLMVARAKPEDGAGEGLVNKNGEWVLLPKNDLLYYLENHKVYVSKNQDPDKEARQLCNAYDETGKLLPIGTYNAIYPANEYFIVGKGDFCDASIEKKSIRSTNPCKFGLVDKTGKIIVPLNFDRVYATGKKDVFEVNVIDKIDGNGKPQIKLGYYNTKGKEIIPVQYDYLSYDSTQKNWFKDKDRTYKALVGDDGIINVTKAGKSGVIDITGKILIPLQYNFVSSFKDGVAFVEKDGNTFYIDKTGKKVNSPEVKPSIYSAVTELPPIRK